MFFRFGQIAPYFASPGSDSASCYELRPSVRVAQGWRGIGMQSPTNRSKPLPYGST